MDRHHIRDPSGPITQASTNTCRPGGTEDVFKEQDYNEGGLYRSATLDAMQDFLLTPLLREAVTYKLAHQINNLRPENQYALGPLDMFPANIGDAADWRNLIFGGWWSWLERWGKLVSILLGSLLPLLLSASGYSPLFSPSVFSTRSMASAPISCGDLDPARTSSLCGSTDDGDGSNNISPRRNLGVVGPRCHQPATMRPFCCDREPPFDHEYLMVHEPDGPPLPRRNVYPPLPTYHSPNKVHQKIVYATAERKALADSAPLTTPPAADSRAAVPASAPVLPLPTDNTPVIPVVPPADRRSPSDVLLPTGPIGDTIKRQL